MRQLQSIAIRHVINYEKMKRILFSLLFLLTVSNVSAQQVQPEATLFAQCMIDLNNQTELAELEVEMKNNPYIKNVRLDYNTKRVFVLTKGIDQLNEGQFISWFNSHSALVRCVQIGTFGVDTVKPFPFEGCEN
jgi:hypothetical protein